MENTTSSNILYHQPPKPNQRVVYINASALKSESNCNLRLIRKIFQGYSRENRLANYKAGYGTAFHKGIEVWYATDPSQRTSELAQHLLTTKVLPTFQPYEPYIESDAKGWRNASHLSKSFIRYTESNPGASDPLTALPLTSLSNSGILKRTSLLEQKFCFPYYESDTLIVYITGTIDMIGEYCGELCIVDHKTTSMKPSDFFELFKLSVKDQFYVYWFKKLSGMNNYIPFLVNGIFIKSNLVADEKKGIFNGVTFQRKMISYDEGNMALFAEWLENKLSEIIANIECLIKTGLNPLYNPAACEGKWSVCQYYIVCSQPKHMQEITLSSSFKQEQYNPLEHIEDEI